MITTYDNAPPLEDWIVHAGRHCGELCFDIACNVCGEFVQRPAVKIPANIVRGSE